MYNLPPINTRKSIARVMKSLVFDPATAEAQENSGGLERFDFILSDFDLLEQQLNSTAHEPCHLLKKKKYILYK